jgi:hypothetical protein
MGRGVVLETLQSTADDLVVHVPHKLTAPPVVVTGCESLSADVGHLLSPRADQRRKELQSWHVDLASFAGDVRRLYHPTEELAIARDGRFAKNRQRRTEGAIRV